MMPPSNPFFDKLIRPKPPVYIVTAIYADEKEELIGLAEDEEAAVQMIHNCRKMPEYKGANFGMVARVLWSKKKDG